MGWRRPAEIVLIRHGESLWNSLIRAGFAIPDEETKQLLAPYANHTIPLTERGWAQARDAGPKIIAEIGLPDCVYDSGYLRAEQTEQALFEHLSEAERTSIRFYHKFELRERDSGYRMYMTEAEYQAAFPWAEEEFRRNGPFLSRPIGGESIADLSSNRVRGVINSVMRDRIGEKVWFICHGHVLRAARVVLERPTMQQVDALIREPTSNLCVLRYVYELNGEKPRRTHTYASFTDL